MKILVIIDVQNDFVNPAWGHLYVNNGENTVPAIIDYIENNVSELREIIFTLDWHPYVDNAFKEPNITWPKHCLQYSEGAAIPQELINTCVDCGIPIKFFIKGNSPEDLHMEYGAFEKIGTWSNENGKLDVVVNNHCNNSLLHINPNDEYVVCGVAGDYCVMNTIKNMMKYTGPNGKLNVSVFMNGIASIDDGTTINDFVKNNNIKIV